MGEAQILKGQVALVTGGSRGIGRALVLMLAREGCLVAFNYHHSEDRAKTLEKEVRALGGECYAGCVDVKDFVAVKAWVDRVKEKFGRLDILINNAGIIMDKALMLMSPEDWAQVIDTNLTGMFNATRACIVTFLKQKSGRVINISSVAGVTGQARQVNYSAAKGGMNAFTKALAKEVAAYGILVNAIAAGYIETEILSGLSEKQREQILQDIPLGKVGQVKDIANCVRFLLSPQSSYITGQIIQVDGGLAIH